MRIEKIAKSKFLGITIILLQQFGWQQYYAKNKMGFLKKLFLSFS